MYYQYQLFIVCFAYAVNEVVKSDVSIHTPGLGSQEEDRFKYQVEAIASLAFLISLTMGSKELDMT